VFIRKNKNRSGSVSVQVVLKTGGAYRVVKTFGSSSDPNVVARLVSAAQDFIYNPHNVAPLFATASTTDTAIQNFVRSLANADIRRVGPELIFGALFDRIGFSSIESILFRHLVIARLVHPASKLKTVDYLQRYHGTRVTEDAIYKFLDRFQKKYKATAERIAYEHTKKTLGTISIVFYDMTTLYFEAEDEDDLRKKGWSKDGKPDCPQIMMALLTGHGGFPIGYDLFEGNTWEGGTLVPMLKKLAEKYQFEKPVVVADAAMLSKKNLAELSAAGYSFIVGGRIKNESEKTKQALLEKTRTCANEATVELHRDDGTRLIVSFSEKRQKKDARNREKGLEKLRRRITAGKLAKEHLNNRGYTKFLTMEGDVAVSIDEDKVADDARWDGLKGYVTNSALPKAEVIERYGDLWQIEYAFRISKTDLRIRPVFHYKRRRIEAHLCIVFVAYVLWKELERLLKKSGIDMSAKRAGELTHTMYAIEHTLPHSQKRERVHLQMDPEQELLYRVIHR